MDDVINYRRIIRELIQDFSQYKPARGDVQIEVIFDESNDHYELMYAGWNGPYLKSQKTPDDPWGNPYVYKTPGEHGPYEIGSYGPAGQQGGDQTHLITSAAR